MADGMECRCGAWSQGECCCQGVDWTPQEMLDLRAELSSAKEENVKLKEELAACKVDAEFRLVDYINAADIRSSDMPHTVIEKLRRVIDAARSGD